LPGGVRLVSNHEPLKHVSPAGGGCIGHSGVHVVLLPSVPAGAVPIVGMRLESIVAASQGPSVVGISHRACSAGSEALSPVCESAQVLPMSVLWTSTSYSVSATILPFGPTSRPVTSRYRPSAIVAAFFSPSKRTAPSVVAPVMAMTAPGPTFDITLPCTIGPASSPARVTMPFVVLLNQMPLVVKTSGGQLATGW
jgi:hypothetical protein